MDLDIHPLWIYNEEINKKKWQMFILVVFITAKNEKQIWIFKTGDGLWYQRYTHNVYEGFSNSDEDLIWKYVHNISGERHITEQYFCHVLDFIKYGCYICPSTEKEWRLSQEKFVNKLLLVLLFLFITV